MHSKTELPSSGRWPIYPHLWHISNQYSTRRNWAEKHYPWSMGGFQKALITLNLYIGRYRKQGHVAFDGPSLDWGKYVQPERGGDGE